MQEYVEKQSGDKYYASEFNDLHKEVSNAVKVSGQNFNASDDKQLAKALIKLGNPVYTVDGTGNGIKLNRAGDVVETLEDGLSVTFNPRQNNTGASTLDYQGLGDKPIKFKGNELVGGELKSNVPVTLIYNGGAWHLQGTLPLKEGNENITGIFSSNPTLADDDDDVAIGEFWKDSNDDLWLKNKSNHSIAVSTDGNKPSNVNDDTTPWLDASDFPYQVKVGDGTSTQNEDNGVGDGTYKDPYKDGYSPVLNGDFFYDGDAIKYRHGVYGDIPVTKTDKVPDGLNDGDKFLNLSKNPPEIDEKTGNNTYDTVETVEKCCSPSDKPENAIQSQDDNEPSGLKVGSYWISSSGQLMKKVAPDISLPVSNDGTRPKNADGSDLADDSLWLNSISNPETLNVIKNGEDYISNEKVIQGSDAQNGLKADGSVKKGKDNVGTALGDVTLGDTQINGELTVDDKTTLNGDVILGKDASTDVTVKSPTSFEDNVVLGTDNGDTITIKGVSNFKEPVTLDDNLFVKGNTTLGDDVADTLTVKATSEFKENSKIDKDLHVLGNLTVDGNTTLGDASSDNIYIRGLTTLYENATLNKNLTVKGNSTLGDSSSDTFEVKGTSTFRENALFKKEIKTEDDLRVDKNIYLTTNSRITFGDPNNNSYMYYSVGGGAGKGNFSFRVEGNYSARLYNKNFNPEKSHTDFVIVGVNAGDYSSSDAPSNIVTRKEVVGDTDIAVDLKCYWDLVGRTLHLSFIASGVFSTTTVPSTANTAIEIDIKNMTGYTPKNYGEIGNGFILLYYSGNASYATTQYGAVTKISDGKLKIGSAKAPTLYDGSSGDVDGFYISGSVALRVDV